MRNILLKKPLTADEAEEIARRRRFPWLPPEVSLADPPVDLEEADATQSAEARARARRAKLVRFSADTETDADRKARRRRLELARTWLDRVALDFQRKAG